MVLLAVAAGTLLYGLVESDNVGWASTQTVVVLLVGAVLMGVFIAHQRSTDSPTLNLELFSLANFRWGNLAMLAFNVSFTAMFFGLVLFLVRVWGWSILEAGLGVAPGPALAAVFAARFGKLAGEIGQRPLVLLGGVVAAISGIYRVVFLTADVDYLLDFAIPLALSAVAIGLVFPQVTSVAVQAVPQNQVGVGGATTQAVRQFGGSLGVALTIALLGTSSGIADLVAGSIASGGSLSRAASSRPCVRCHCARLAVFRNSKDNCHCCDNQEVRGRPRCVPSACSILPAPAGRFHRRRRARSHKPPKSWGNRIIVRPQIRLPP